MTQTIRAFARTSEDAQTRHDTYKCAITSGLLVFFIFYFSHTAAVDGLQLKKILKHMTVKQVPQFAFLKKTLESHLTAFTVPVDMYTHSLIHTFPPSPPPLVSSLSLLSSPRINTGREILYPPQQVRNFRVYSVPPTERG